MNYPKSRSKDLVIQTLNSETMIYDIASNKAFCLNQTSAMVWQLCDGKKSATDIASALSRNSGKEIDENIVWLALNQLKSENLLENKESFVSKFDGLSRREAIRRVSFASMIALPMISSLTAPTSVMAASAVCAACPSPGSIANGGNCANNCACASCCCSDNGLGEFVCITPNTPGFACL